MSFREDLGKKIKQRMNRLNITADTLCWNLSVSPATISRIMTGHTDTLNWKHLEQLAELLDWTMSDMMDVRATPPATTGVRTIDQAITKFNTWLFAGDEGYKILKEMTDPDYYLVYTKHPPRSKDRHGPNLKDELKNNAEWVKTKSDYNIQIKAASILKDNLIILNRYISTVPLKRSGESLEINGAQFATRREVVNKSKTDPIGLEEPANLLRPIKIERNSVLDVWELSNKVTEIKKGQPIVIIRRYVESLYRWVESE